MIGRGICGFARGKLVWVSGWVDVEVHGASLGRGKGG